MDSVNKRQKRWIYSIVSGVISIIIGALLVIYKKDALDVILIISGVLLIFDGAIAIIGGLMDKVAIPVVVGGLFVALGIAMIVFTALFADIFMVLLGILFIFLGILGAMSAFEKSMESFIGMIFSLVFAILLIAAGIIVLFNIDDAADWVMIAVGIMSIVSGVIDVIGGLLTYRLMKDVKEFKEKRQAE